MLREAPLFRQLGDAFVRASLIKAAENEVIFTLGNASSPIFNFAPVWRGKA